MAEFVTIEEANQHLRAGIDIDSPLADDAADLSQKLDAAESIILNYLKVDIEDSPVWEPSDQDLPNLKAAILIMLSGLWDDREGTGIGDYLRQDGAIARLLMRMRDPVLA